MSVSSSIVGRNASVLVSEFSQYGSLLDINNRIRTATTKVSFPYYCFSIFHYF